MLRTSAARTLSLDKVLYSDGLSFGVVRHSRQVQLSFVQSMDAFIIQTASNREVAEICREIRTQHNPEDYLKPIFMVANPGLKAHWRNEIDGYTTLDNLTAVTETAQLIHRQIAKLALVENPPQTVEVEVLIKVLQFLFTRNTDLQPFPNRHSKIHFQFPFASHFFDESEEQKVLFALKLAEKQGWLNGKVVEKIHLCPDCGSTHHTLRATCPKCSSVDLQEEDLVHHFPCAHIAPISDFERANADGLHCPKCDKSLRHIGNDYDKPSSIYNCNSCHHPFQQSNFKSLCVDCGADNELDKLEEWDVKKYELSAKGKSVVINGTGFGKVAQPKINKPVGNGIFEFDVFKILLKQEISKRKTNPRPGVVGQVKIEGILLDKMPLRTKEELTIEVCQIIKSYLNEPDVVSAKGPNSFYFLMTEYGLAEAQYLDELLTFNLQQLIGSNFRGTSIKVKVQMESLAK
jgi:ribosomal protein S27AE